MPIEETLDRVDRIVEGEELDPETAAEYLPTPLPPLAQDSGRILAAPEPTVEAVAQVEAYLPRSPTDHRSFSADEVGRGDVRGGRPTI